MGEQAVAIAHYAPIANVLQTALFNRVHEDYAPREKRRFRPGDVSLARESLVICLFNRSFILLDGGRVC